MKTTDEYVGLITPQHADKPKFVATVEVCVAPVAALQLLLASLPVEFDLDEAIGIQLDAVGIRVGRSRKVPVFIAGLFFTWGDVLRGWGRGIWKGPFDPTSGIASLDDETYRRLLRAKVLANSWDGTADGQQAILDAYFTDPETFVAAIDDTGAAYPGSFFTWGDPLRGWGSGTWYDADAPVANLPSFNPHMLIIIAGKIPSLLDLALLSQDLIAAKPVGVALDYAVTSVDQTPVFGWGVENEFIGGWGTGAWAVPPDFIAEHTA